MGGIVHIVRPSIGTVSVVTSVIMIEPSRRIMMMARVSCCSSSNTEEQFGLPLLLRGRRPRKNGPELSRGDPNANGIPFTR